MWLPSQQSSLLFMIDLKWSIEIYVIKVMIVWVQVLYPCHLDQLPVVIRLLEYMIRFLILFTHYCYGETDFISSRDASFEKWFAELVDFYKKAIESGYSWLLAGSWIGQYSCLENCGEVLSYYIIHKNNQRAIREKKVRFLSFHELFRLSLRMLWWKCKWF